MTARPYHLVIEAGRVERHYWADLWRFRELLWYLCWRDFLVRYKQTALGIAWAFIRPFLTMVVFTVVFGKIAALPSGNTPYALLVFAGLLPWQLFATALADAGNSLVSNANLISKVYFPRLIIPLSTILVSLIDFLVSLTILAGVMWWYSYAPGARILLLPLFTLLAIGNALGIGLWAGALTTRFRDVRFLIPFVVQMGLYISPVGFSSGVIPEQWRTLYSLNPMVGVIDGFRWAILGADFPVYWAGFALSCAINVALIVTGVLYFRRTEKTFADVI